MHQCFVFIWSCFKRSSVRAGGLLVTRWQLFYDPDRVGLLVHVSFPVIYSRKHVRFSHFNQRHGVVNLRHTIKVREDAGNIGPNHREEELKKQVLPLVVLKEILLNVNTTVSEQTCTQTQS